MAQGGNRAPIGAIAPRHCRWSTIEFINEKAFRAFFSLPRVLKQQEVAHHEQQRTA